MTTLQEAAMRKALNFCEFLYRDHTALNDYTDEQVVIVMKYLRTALAQQGQEPAAIIEIVTRGNETTIDNHFMPCVRSWPNGEHKLYAAPAPQAQPLRELSDEEVEALWDTELSADVGITALRKIARAVLKKARGE